MKTLLLWILPFSVGCAQLLDGDHDYHLGPGGGGAASSTVTSSGGAGGAGGTPSTVHCPPKETACGASCTDLSSDPTSCGYCGHDCQGGACNDGLCEVTELITGLSHPDSLAVDQTHVFFTTQNGTIQRVPKQGGVPDILAEGVGVPWSLVLHTGHVYWAERLQKVIQRTGKNGLGGVKTLCDPQINVDRLAIDNKGVYFVIPFNVAGQGPGSIGRVPLGGGAVQWIAQDLSFPHYLFVTDDRVYFGQAESDGQKFVNGSISEAPLQGGTPFEVVSGEDVVQDLTVDAEALYWVNDVDQNVRKKTFATGEITTLATGQDTPYMMTMDETHVYWTTLFAGTVARVAKVGGPVETLASGRERPFALAVDGKRVYWTESLEVGRVMSVPK